MLGWGYFRFNQSTHEFCKVLEFYNFGREEFLYYMTTPCFLAKQKKLSRMFTGFIAREWKYRRFLPLSVQFSSVTQSCPTLCDPTDCSMPGLPVYHQLPEFTQTPVRWGHDAIQPSHPLSSPSPAFNLSQHQGLFKWVSSLYQVVRVLEFQLQHQSFQWIFRTDFFSIDWFDLLAV